MTMRMKSMSVQDPDLVSMIMKSAATQSKDRKLEEKKTVLKSWENKENTTQL